MTIAFMKQLDIWFRVATLALIGVLLAGCGAREPEPKGGPPGMRRLTESQYRQTIADIFGTNIKVSGTFEPEIRTDGLLALGGAQGGLTPAAYDQYDSFARDISQQVLDAANRESRVPCRPKTQSAADANCAERFLAKYGRLLFRRSVSPADMAPWVNAAGKATEISHDFYAGLQIALSGMLVAPDFLYRTDVVEPDPDRPSHVRLSGFSKASRISFLLWDTSPDEQLLEAAERGDLHSSKGLDAQVQRLLASPRLDAGMRAFFSDFLGFEAFDTLAKDAVIYPNFRPEVAAAAREQTLRLVVDHLLTRKQDYRDLFTTRHTFMNRTLGMVYRVGVKTESGWEDYEFPPDDPRAGLLTHLSFTALHSHPGRSSPTLRGKAMRELLLCQTVPPPPPNVDFSAAEMKGLTARERLKIHSTSPSCAGCHKVMDPVGLGLENFDGAGQLREQENGMPILIAGNLDGTEFKSAAEVGTALRENPALPACVADRLYAYGVGRRNAPADKQWRDYLHKGFAADGYRFPDLLERIVTSKHFYEVSAPPVAQLAGVQ